MAEKGWTRRNFLKKAGAVTVLGTAGALDIPGDVWARAGTYATLIDLTKCDGCRDLEIPKCVEACRVLNEKRFPVPEKPIKDLWPQKTHDDWSDRKGVFHALTPYNWTTVQRVSVDGEDVFVPRRCMHCDSAPCASLCPFGALNKFDDGAVVINPDLCLGGAKCKAVCPWHIPQRQSGVGIYLKIQPLPAGGGVMYKCDLCHDRIGAGKIPACVEACEKRLGEKRSLFFGRRDEILKTARARAKEIGGEIYGEKENGGTATLYVSRVPFEKIDAKLREKKAAPHMGKARSLMQDVNAWAGGFVLSPLVMALGALGLIFHERRKKGNGKEGKEDEK